VTEGVWASAGLPWHPGGPSPEQEAVVPAQQASGQATTLQPGSRLGAFLISIPKPELLPDHAIAPSPPLLCMCSSIQKLESPVDLFEVGLVSS